jgi:hypothetical protein
LKRYYVPGGEAAAAQGIGVARSVPGANGTFDHRLLMMTRFYAVKDVFDKLGDGAIAEPRKARSPLGDAPKY